MDDAENQKQQIAERLEKPYQATVQADLRWGYWTNLKADEALKYLKETIFPKLRSMGAKRQLFLAVYGECRM